MTTHTTIISLLGAALLLGATGCSHHEATPVGTGSYQLNGSLVTCQANASLSTSYKGVDRLTVHLTTTPEPASGPEAFSLVFQKTKGHPDTDYAHQEAYYTGNGQQLSQGFLYSPQATITPTASGGFSGTFSVPPSSGATGSIQNGTFTEARVQ